MTQDEAKAVFNRISLAPNLKRIGVSLGNGAWGQDSVRLSCWISTANSISSVSDEVTVNMAETISFDNMAEDHFAEVILQLVIQLLKHEALEGVLLDKQPIQNPHPEIGEP